MREAKRIFLNKFWIGTNIVLLIVNLFMYWCTQISDLGVSIDSYATYTNKLYVELKQYGIEEGLELITNRIGSNQAECVALERWQERLAYRVNYVSNIMQIEEQAKSIQKNPLYSEKTSFEYRNAEKTAKEFNSIQNIELCLYPDDVLTSIVCYEANVIFYISAIFVTVIFILKASRDGVEPLLKTTRNGRTKLSGYRVGIILLSSSINVCFSICSQLVIGSILYQQKLHLYSSIQSIRVFRNWTYNMSVFEFLLWYIVIQTMGICLIGLLLWNILSIFESMPLGITVMLSFFIWQYSCFCKFDINDAGYWLATYNIFHLLSVIKIILRYLNYNVLGIPFKESFIVAMTIFILVGMLIIISVLRTNIQKRINGFGIIKRMNIFMQRRANYRLLPLALYEVKKIVLFSGGIIFFVGGTVLMLSNRPDELWLNQKEALLREYINIYSGPINQETFIQIKALKEVAESEYEEHANRNIEKSILSYYEANKWALSTLYMRYTELLEFKQNGIEKLYLMDDKAYEQIYGETGLKFRTISGGIVLSMICLTIPLLFSIEHKNNMHQILFGSKKGRKYLWVQKFLIMLGEILIIWIVWSLYDIYLYYCNYEGKGNELFFANVLSLYSENCIEEKNVILWYILVFCIKRLTILILVGIVVFMISSKFQSFLYSCGICASIFIVPFFLERLGVVWMEKVSCIDWLAGKNVLVPQRNYLLFGIYLGVCIISVVLSMRFWKRESKIVFD